MYSPHRSPLALFGESKVLCSDAGGFATMYNPELHAFLSMPELNWPCYLHPPYRCPRQG